MLNELRKAPGRHHQRLGEVLVASPGPREHTARSVALLANDGNQVGSDGLGAGDIRGRRSEDIAFSTAVTSLLAASTVAACKVMRM